MGNFAAIASLATGVCAAYSDCPNDYKDIAEKAKSLWRIIIKATAHFQGTSLSDEDQKESQEILKSCQSVLEDLIEKPRGPSTRPVFKAAQLSAEDITTLTERLRTNVTLLTNFTMRRFDISTISI